jgi:hypothetical protein
MGGGVALRRNSKSEIRMTKQVRIPKLETNLTMGIVIGFVIRISNLIRHSDFGFRVSAPRCGR